jgi:putative PIN family toxin of toxin-antitoxin system
MNRKLFVFDTNVFLSALIIKSSVSSFALDKAFKTGKVIVSEAILLELTEVLFRKKFDKYFTDERRYQIIDKLEHDTVSFKVTKFIKACRDPKDDKFLELAVTAKANYIISGDSDLLVLNPFKSIQIVTPAEFLNQL